MANSTVNTPCTAYVRMSERWELIRDLLGGTEAMKAKSERWLPKEPNEKPGQYKIRLSRTYLYNALKDTLVKHASKPFSKAVTVDEGVPEPLDQLETNVDREGTTLSQFCEALFGDAEAYGLTHYLVDYSKAPIEKTRKDEESVRPSFHHVKAVAMIGWKSKLKADGSRVLTQIRFRRTATVASGEYGDKEVVEVIKYDHPADSPTGIWSIHRLAEDGKGWVVIDSGEYHFTHIPLVTIYFNKTAFMEAEPPLERLAEVNLAHYQSNSDHRNILRFARVGILFGSGFSKEQEEKGITISPTQAVITANDKARLEYVEYGKGGAIEAGERDLTDLEDQMQVLGVQPLVEQSGEGTATSAEINEAKGLTMIQAWLLRVEDGIEAGYRMAADWWNNPTKRISLPEDFNIEIFNDFTMGGNPNENEFLLNACLARKLPTRVFLSEVQRRGIIAPNWDLDDVEDMIEAEPPDEGLLPIDKDREGTRPGGLAKKAKARAAKQSLARSGPGKQSGKK